MVVHVPPPGFAALVMPGNETHKLRITRQQRTDFENGRCKKRCVVMRPSFVVWEPQPLGHFLRFERKSQAFTGRPGRVATEGFRMRAVDLPRRATVQAQQSCSRGRL